MISIKFSKTKGPSKVIKDSHIRDESTRDDEEEKDFVTSVDKRQIHGTKKKEEKKELVIPLIAKNEWKKGVLKREEEAEKKRAALVAKPPPQQLSLEEQAINELLGQPEKVAVQEDDEVEDIPLLLQNKVPKGYEEDDNMDVSLRADQSSLEDYEQIPIDEFGMAMLRGMGWNKKEGIGLKNKQHVEMLEPQLRPKGLGLGASVSSQVKKGIQNSQGSKDDEELFFKIGAGALIEKGPEKGMYARIEAFDEDNNRVVVKLAITGKMSDVSKFHITLVKESEYKGKSKILNYSQYAEYKEKHDLKDSERRSQKERDQEEEGKSQKKIKHERDSKSKKDSSNHDTSKSSNYSNSRSSSKNWVRPHLKVRFIDKKYKNGKHYQNKFVVDDVIEHDRFVLRSDSGNTLLEDINSSQLETVIPKDTHSAVCILNGRHKGKIGELVERNRSTETAIIKIPDGAVYELSYYDICEFIGDPEDFY